MPKNRSGIAEFVQRFGHACIFRLRQGRDGDFEARRSEVLRDAKADALLAAGYQSHTSHAADSVSVMCRAARRARAAMVRAGLTAAEVGRTEASTMNRFL